MSFENFVIIMGVQEVPQPFVFLAKKKSDAIKFGWRNSLDQIIK